MGKPGVYTQIVDGGLGILPPNANTVGVAGTAEGTTKEEVLLIGNPRDAEDQLVAGSALECVRDIFAVRNAPSVVKVVLADMTGATAADAGTVTHTGTGNATFETGGTPTSDRYFVIKITSMTAGGSGVGAGWYKISTDNGESWSAEKNMPESGVAIDLGNGATITFTNSTTTPELVVGDTYAWKTTEAKPTTEKLLDALEILDDEKDLARAVVALDVDSTFAASVSALLNTRNTANVYFPVLLQVERPDYDTEETASAWIARINTEWESFYDERIGKTAFMGYLTDVKGQSLIRNAVGIVAGLRASAKVCDSVAWVRKYPIDNCLKIFPKDITDAQLDALLFFKFIAGKYWDGYGFRVYKTVTCANDASDFQRLEDLETMYKAVRLVTAAAIPWIESTADPASEPAFKGDMERPLANMRDIDKEISDYSLTLLETDILATGEVKVQLSIVPFGKRSQITLIFGFTRSVS